MKIVQEGGLEPLALLTQSDDIEIQREVASCLCNLSLSDENRYELAKAGCVPPLIELARSEDMILAPERQAAGLGRRRYSQRRHAA